MEDILTKLSTKMRCYELPEAISLASKVLSPLLGLLLLSIWSSGCATSYSHATHARANNPGEVQVAAGYQFSGSSHLIDSTLSTAGQVRNDLEEDEDLTEEDLRDYLDWVVNALLFRPGHGFEFIGRIGLTDAILEGMDLGVRYNGTVLKGDIKLQLWESANTKHALSFDFGYGHHLDLVSETIEYATLTSFSRSDFDFYLVYGWEHADIVKLYGGPRVMISKISTDPKIPDWLNDQLPDDVREKVDQYNPNQFFEDEAMIHTGITWGAMFGYKYAYILFDITMMWVEFSPTVLGSERDYSGGIFSPLAAISLHYDF